VLTAENQDIRFFFREHAWRSPYGTAADALPPSAPLIDVPFDYPVQAFSTCVLPATID